VSSIEKTLVHNSFITHYTCYPTICVTLKCNILQQIITDYTTVGSLKYQMNLFHTLLQLIISLIRVLLVFTNHSLDYGWPHFTLVKTVFLLTAHICMSYTATTTSHLTHCSVSCWFTTHRSLAASQLLLLQLACALLYIHIIIPENKTLAKMFPA
jgi:hypothetical protein